MAKSTRSLLSLIIVSLAFALLYWGGTEVLFGLRPCDSASVHSAIIEVHRGMPPKEIAKALKDQMIICSDTQFLRLGRITRSWARLKAGEYQVTSAMTPIKLFSVLASGISVPHPITLREGENTFEIAGDLDSKGLASKETLLALIKNQKFIDSLWNSLELQGPAPASLEGYLYPDTYYLNKTLTPEEILKQMVRRFKSAWTPEEGARARVLGLTRHEIITLASIIEKETGAPQERPMISSVFHNRLKKHMRLQSDPTIIYGIWSRYDGNLHKADILSPTPYNTYVIPALPVGPIGNPGKDSIHAALYPDTSDFLFFVSQNDGTHRFSRDLKEHTDAVRRFQLDPKARQGKSWRDLKKAKATPPR